MDEFARLLFLLVAGHAIGDFALQTDWIAANKERPKNNGMNSECKRQTIWPYVLAAHSLHHGLIVFLITQRLSLGIAETIVHGISDFAKGERYFGFQTDQWIHIGSKLLWALALIKGWC